jgi:lycopene epsilon-cyclase
MSHFHYMHTLNLTFSSFNIGFHPIGYSVVRSLSEAPEYAKVIATILNESNTGNIVTRERIKENPSMRGNQVYP